MQADELKVGRCVSLKELINVRYIVKGLRRFIVTLDVFLESFKIEVNFKSVRINKQFNLKLCEAIFQ